jgi:hypothetical protein
MTMLQRAFPVLLAGAAVTAAVPLGCRNVIGIQQLGSDELTCDAYCDAIGAVCTGDQLQYVTRDACMGLCPTFPVGTLGDIGVNTLGCRLAIAKSLAGGEGACVGAGPGGAGYCGSDCDSFCASAVQVCPTDFASDQACRALCLLIPECPNYFVTPGVTPDADTIQCRLYHLTAASLDPTTHCPHVRGEELCTPTSPKCATSGADGG